MKRSLVISLILILLIIVSLTIFIKTYYSDKNEYREILVLSAPIAKPILDQAVSMFVNKTGIQVKISYEASGNIFTKLSQKIPIDVVIFASEDWGEKAVKNDLVYPDTKVGIGYQIVLLYVRKDLGDNISCIDDLVNSDVKKIGIADPKTAPAGVEALQIINKSIYKEEIMRKIVVAKDVGELVTWFRMRAVDAAFIWNIYNSSLKEISRIIYPWRCGYETNIYYSVAYVSKTSKNPDLAREFIRFLGSEDVKKIIREKGFFTDYQEAENFMKR
jgi:molybdate transport system substrate-binding protein